MISFGEYMFRKPSKNGKIKADYGNSELDSVLDTSPRRQLASAGAKNESNARLPMYY